MELRRWRVGGGGGEGEGREIGVLGGGLFGGVGWGRGNACGVVLSWVLVSRVSRCAAWGP